MAFKQSKHIFTGMSKDLSEDKQKAEFYIDAHNIRITAREDTTLLSVTNEKGNTQLNINPEDSLKDDVFKTGQYIGHAVLNDYLVLFLIVNSKDTIYRVNLKTNTGKLLYSGKLGFSVKNPIETLVDFETEELQKVYWTDGINSPRVINITKKYNAANTNSIDSQFDFIPEVYPSGVDTLSVYIENYLGTEGMFAAGTVQYFISYFNKFGQESNIVWQSPLLYTSWRDRGGSPAETLTNSFKLTISKPTGNFEYIRLYSVQHTSQDTDLIGRKVVDLEIPENSNESIIYIDNGTGGESINPSDLYYKGGVPVIVGTMAAKDQTLFLGNIKLNNQEHLPESLVDSIKNLGNSLKFSYKSGMTPEDVEGKYYAYNNQLLKTSYDITTFKNRETYRLGLQFQDKWGRWSEPVWIGDKINNIAPVFRLDHSRQVISLSQAILNLSDVIQGDINPIISSLKALNYVKVRPVIVLPQEYERECVAQGVLNPTVYNLGDRKTNSPYAQPSWFFRPYEGAAGDNIGQPPLYAFQKGGTALPYKHNAIIQGKTSIQAEIEKAPEIQVPPCIGRKYNDKDLDDKNFFIDQSILTLNSPDLEFSDSIYNTALSDCKFRLVGVIDVTGFSGALDLIAKSAPNNFYIQQGTDSIHPYGSRSPIMGDVAEGYNITNIRRANIKDSGWTIMGNGFWWYDTPYTDWFIDDLDNYCNECHPSRFRCGFKVFPWQATGSLNNTSNKTEQKVDAGDAWPINTNTAALDRKVLSNLRYSAHTVYFGETIQGDDGRTTADCDKINYRTTDIQFIDSDIQNAFSMHTPSNVEAVYYSNIDKLLDVPVNTVEEILNGDNFYTNRAFGLIYDWDIIIGNVSYREESDYTSNESGVGGLTLRHSSCLFNSNDFHNSDSDDNGTMILNLNAIRDNREFKKRQVRRVNSQLSTKTTATSITYKTFKHAIIALDNSNENTLTVLPYINHYKQNGLVREGIGKLAERRELQREVEYGVYESSESGTHIYKSDTYLWNKSYDHIYQNFIRINSSEYFDMSKKGILFLGEIYRDNIVNKFGGNTPSAIQQNLWIPAGESVDLQIDAKIKWVEGDTYFQRYDCLKTYPYSNENENNIVEILSFLCESRINIAGRYDKNRGLLNNNYITNENFNLLNSVYTQKDNFYSYRILDDRFDTKTFSSKLTWTKTKSAGAEVDNWTSVTLANTLDLDGDKGELVSLNNYNNDIIAFQPKGISVIIYNPNVQISTESGLPVELANSGRVEGKNYIYKGVGCQNKWSICDEVYGSIYFIDNLGEDIYRLNKEGLQSLTNIKGLKEWMHSVNTTELWKPYVLSGMLSSNAAGNFRTFYDNIHKDLYFVNGETTLVYSTFFDQFISFMDYQRTNAMFNCNGDFYSLYNGYIWKQFDGEYNKIYNQYRDYSITFIENQFPEISKIFTNLEYRSDMFKSNGELESFETFDTIRAWNEYQDSGEVAISKLQGLPQISSLQKKFRVWRIQLPRDKDNPLDRIRNTWSKFTLKRNASLKNDNKRLILHDSIIDYYF